MTNALDDFLVRYSPEIRGVVLNARALILTEMAGALEQVDPASGIIAYGYGTKYADLICALAPFKNHVNLMFSAGASLPDPTGLLEGTGKKARHVRLVTLKDINNPAVTTLLRAAIQGRKGGG